MIRDLHGQVREKNKQKREKAGCKKTVYHIISYSVAGILMNLTYSIYSHLFNLEVTIMGKVRDKIYL